MGASYEDRVFPDCLSFTTLNIGENVTNIPENAFSGCSGLTSVTFPNSVTSIGSEAFYNCSGLSSVTIGNSVTNIYGYAFSGCENISVINISANTPPELGTDAFPSTLYSTATLNVPYGAKGAYENANEWSNFQNIRQNSATGGNVSWVTIGSDDSFIGELLKLY